VANTGKTMKITYDPKVDILRILLSDAPVAESNEEKPCTILDYDKDGNLVGLEILDASSKVADPRRMEYTIAE
jgi:uncharacterized protein YuzE